MDNTLHISTALDQQSLLESMVVKLAGNRKDYGITKIKMQRGLKAIDTSSAEVYLSGNISFSYTSNENAEEIIRMPFITSFYFTCIKTKNKSFQLGWSSSLS